jgi:hypothetical protein
MSLHRLLTALVLLATLPALVHAQAGAGAKDAKVPKDSAAPPKEKKPSNTPLFKSETPLEVTLTLNVKQIKKDRGQDAPWRAATLSYVDNGKTVTIPIRARTRGVWRLRHCDFPPLRLDIKDKDAKGTVFADIDEPKLVTFCRNSALYESYVLQEAQLYRVQRVLTDAAHKVRIVRMTYTDSATGKVEATRHSFIIEDPAQVAVRLGGGVVKQKGASPADLDPPAAAMAFTFLYFIANTDVSFNGLHNGEIIGLNDGRYVPIPYDFDFAGVINAGYAAPDPSLPIKSVSDRLFRGYCEHRDAYQPIFDLFNEKRGAIEALYADSIGKLLSPGTINSHLKYYNAFWDQIKTPENAKRKILSDCLK